MIKIRTDVGRNQLGRTWQGYGPATGMSEGSESRAGFVGRLRIPVRTAGATACLGVWVR